MNAEQERLLHPEWKKWGSYISDRQWGTVREDYSPNGDAWKYTTHDMARSKTWRWGEDGIAGICDARQLLCFSIALWNKRDPLLKERFFGLTNDEGNHGEDVKELYYYLDATPTHSYMKMLYKYPQQEFPYQWLTEENKKRSRDEEEFEIINTGIFDNNEYFDVFTEYAKTDADDILVKISIYNRGNQSASLLVLPTLWFRNTWIWGRHSYKPELSKLSSNTIRIKHTEVDVKFFYFERGDTLFCENETNNQRLYNSPNVTDCPKDGINDHIIHGAYTINTQMHGTKAAIQSDVVVQPGECSILRLRLSNKNVENPFANFDETFRLRVNEANEFYNDIQKNIKDEDERLIQRQAFAGMLWNKQFYCYKVHQWLEGDPATPPPPPERWHGRNANWKQLNNEDIISVPDKWEFPWYATWDLAFHCITLALIDPAFAKQQLLLLTEEWYINPAGEFPAYEWSLSDANPPVHAAAAYQVFKQDEKRTGKKDYYFLESVFHKLIINFTWWVNKKDQRNNNIFEGGFLGLDNISVIDRSLPLADGAVIEQADATSWMAMYALNMLNIALELSGYNKSYTGTTTKFFEHFLYIAGAMASMGDKNNGLWDEEDEFYYDQVHMPDNTIRKIKVKSLVGLIPLFAVEVITKENLEQNPVFAQRMEWFLQHRPDLASLVSRWYEKGEGEKHLLSLLRGHRMKRLLYRALDETEFLSDYGIRSLSKKYAQHPYYIDAGNATTAIKYTPGESESAMYGGNSNWRGPIWLPMNFLIIESLREFHLFYSDDFKIEYPTASGNYISLKQVSAELTNRLLKIFLKDKEGKRPVYGNIAKLQTDPYFKDYILFHEYFHGDSGKGLGASHQTGWTGVIANLISLKNND